MLSTNQSVFGPAYDGRNWYKDCKIKLNNKNFNFTVASYNVLAQDLLDDNSYLYVRSESNGLNWDVRKWRLLEEICHNNPDILCLQEVQKEHYYNFFKPQLASANYESSYKARTGGKPDGCAIFFKKDKFSFFQEKLIAYKKVNCAILDRDNVAIVMLLKTRPCYSQNMENLLCITNTHILFNEKRGDIKLAQLMTLFASINEIRPPYTPLIMCGDFNLQPFSPLYNFIRKGRLICSELNQHTMSGQNKNDNNWRQLKDDFLFNTGLTDQCQFLREESKKNSVPEKLLFGDDIAKQKDQSAMTCNASQNAGTSFNNENRKQRQNTETNSPNNFILTNDEDWSVCSKIHKPTPHIQSDANKIENNIDMFSGRNIRMQKEVNNEAKQTMNSRDRSDAVDSKMSESNSCATKLKFNKQAPMPSNISDQQKLQYDNNASSTEDNKLSSVSSIGSGIITHDFKLKSVYMHYDRLKENNEVTTSHNRAQCTVDYIFYTPIKLDEDNSLLNVTQRLELLTVEHMIRHPAYLPDDFHGSDHYMIMAEFALLL